MKTKIDPTVRAKKRNAAARERTRKLTDGVVRKYLCRGESFGAKDLPSDLVELKRSQIRLHRAIRTVKDGGES